MQDLLESMFGTTGGMVARYVIAFLVVLLLLLALRWFVKRFMGTAAPGPTRGRQPRLAVMDVAVVDARRRLVLVRPDGYIAWAGSAADRTAWRAVLAKWTGSLCAAGGEVQVGGAATADST